MNFGILVRTIRLFLEIIISEINNNYIYYKVYFNMWKSPGNSEPTSFTRK